jgi:hypothetical protein
MDTNSNSRIEKSELAKFLGCDESSDEVKDALQRMGDECSDGCVSFEEWNRYMSTLKLDEEDFNRRFEETMTQMDAVGLPPVVGTT